MSRVQFLAILDVLPDDRYQVCVGNKKNDVMTVWKTCQQMPRTVVCVGTIVWPAECSPLGGSIMYQVISDTDVVLERSYIVVGIEPMATIPTVEHAIFKLSHSDYGDTVSDGVSRHTKKLRTLVRMMCVILDTSCYETVLTGFESLCSQPVSKERSVPDAEVDWGVESDEEMESVGWEDAEREARAIKKARVASSAGVVSIPTGHWRFKALKCPSSCVDFLYHVVRIDLRGLFGRFDKRCTSRLLTDEFERSNAAAKYWPRVSASLRAPWLPERVSQGLSNDMSSAPGIMLSWLYCTASSIPAELVFLKFPSAFPHIYAGKRLEIASRCLEKVRNDVFSRWTRVRAFDGNPRVFKAIGIGSAARNTMRVIMGGARNIAQFETLCENVKERAVVVYNHVSDTLDPATHTILRDAHFATPKMLVAALRESATSKRPLLLVGNPYHVGYEYGGVWQFLTDDVPFLPASLLKEYTCTTVNEQVVAALTQEHSKTLVVSPIRDFCSGDHVIDLLSPEIAEGCDFLVTRKWDHIMLSTALACAQNTSTFYLFQSPFE